MEANRLWCYRDILFGPKLKFLLVLKYTKSKKDLGLIVLVLLNFSYACLLIDVSQDCFPWDYVDCIGSCQIIQLKQL